MSDNTQKRVLTGVKPTGSPHLGNLLGAIRPAIEMANTREPGNSLLFIADYHALTTIQSKEELRHLTYDVAATWLALGLDTSKTYLYRQSDIAEVFEMSWILSCFTSKGLMNRAHAYKARVGENEASGKKDLDDGIGMGLYTYPILMSADIVSFDAHEVPVGEDQVQHLEIARDIAQRLNHNYKKDLLVLPKAILPKQVPTIPGLDGQKMSKSYHNTIPLFLESKKLRKLVMKIKTDSTPPEEPKETKGSLIFTLYKQFASADEIDALANRYASGIGWGEAKEELYQVLERTLREPREKYNELMATPEKLEEVLKEGADKARLIAKKVVSRVHEAIC